MIIACIGCHQSYDLSSYKPGQRCRCRCGQILTVPKDNTQLRAARTLHCANCGGHLVPGQPNCGFCGALIDLTHARLTAYCTSCLSMSKEGAQFCSECGKPLVKNVDQPAETDEECPRCAIRMRRRTVGVHSVVECPICCGLFVNASDLETMIEQQKGRIEQAGGDPTKRAVKGDIGPEPVAYLKCPACANMMNRINYGRASGVIIDFCKAHGYWLDAGELEKIAKWVATGGLVEQQAKQLEEMKAETRRLAAEQLISRDRRSDERDPFSRYRSGSGWGVFDILSRLFD